MSRLKARPIPWPDDGDSAEPGAFVVAVAEGEHKAGVELRVQSRSGVLSGTVLDADGAPVPDAWVTASIQVNAKEFGRMMAGPEVPDPEGLPTFRERLEPLCEATEDERERAWFSRDRPIDSRYVTDVAFVDPEPLPPRLEVWLRADGRLPESQLIQQCVVAYASDMTLLDTAILPHGFSWYDRSWTVASLDHAMWFHRPFRADEWLYYHQESPSSSGARGFSRGEIYTQDGTLVISVAQEGLVRPRRRRGQ